MATRKTKASAGQSSSVQMEPLTLAWTLAELPSSQHRAGLAGLVLCVRYLHRLPGRAGVCEINVQSHGGSLRIDEKGLAELFDVVYAASMTEQESSTPWKKKDKSAVTPLRVEERTDINPKTRKEQKKSWYIYERPVPEGGPLLELDPTREGNRGLWIKLWRDFIWTIMRGVPAQREPFEARADGAVPSAPSHPTAVLAILRGDPDATVDLPSTYFLGAQALTAEDVPYKDRARYQLLLHFWPFAASVYAPATEDRDGKRTFAGYAVAIPDVADLKWYCEELPGALRARSAERVAYLPRESVVALPAEAGLSMLHLLGDRVAKIEGGKTVGSIVLGLDVIHAEKPGNAVKVSGVTRIEPDPEMAGEYGRLHSLLWDLPYRRVRVGNLLARRPWFHGFDRLLSTHPVERLLGRSTFAHDAREDFDKRFSRHEGPMTKDEGADASLEGILLQVVQGYLSRKLGTKRGLKWSDVKDNEEKKGEYSDEKEKLAKSAFLAIRSRTGRDFVDYFASTLCSVPQRLDGERFGVLAAALRERPDEVRTLTMLALSARS